VTDPAGPSGNDGFDRTDSLVGESYPRQSARTRGFRLGAPRLFRVSRDGHRVVFLRSAASDDAVGRLVVLEVASESETVVADPLVLLDSQIEDLSPTERSRRERMREAAAGIVGYTTDRDVTRAAFGLSGGLYVVDLTGTAPAHRLPVPGPVLDPRLSPDGEWVAYVVGGAIHVVSWDGSDDRELAVPETSTVAYGTADFIAAEELDRSVGLWWSPTSDSVLAERYDEADVPIWWIADPVHPAREPVQHRYPAAGAANPAVSLHLLTLNGVRTEIDWDHKMFPYLGDVSWTSYGDPLVVLLDRTQRQRLVLALEPSTGVGRVVLADSDPSWIDTSPGQVRWAPDGRLLTVKVAADTYRLAAGEAMLSPEGTQVAALLDVTPDNSLLLLQDSSTTAYLATVGWDGVTSPLTPQDGWVSGSRGGGTLVTATSTWDSATASVQVTRADGTSFVVASYAESPHVAPRVTLLEAGERRIITAVVFPRDHVPGARQLPILLAPYGGPHHSEAIPAVNFGVHQWFADQGFVVVVADGRGTPGRGPGWERAISGDFVGPILEDQVTAVEAVLAAYPNDVDTSRVGIRGWSFGGYLAALAVLRRPDVFHAAVAGAPVTDWRLYDTAYTERYLGQPQQVPAVYEANSLLSMAATLQRPLLLIHGMTDDNVAVAHTLALSGALTAAGRPHQVLPLSGVTHITPQEDVAENRLLLELHFLRSALGA
jgi:dipeptidyl-peptidase-4